MLSTADRVLYWLTTITAIVFMVALLGIVVWFMPELVAALRTCP